MLRAVIYIHILLLQEASVRETHTAVLPIGTFILGFLLGIGLTLFIIKSEFSQKHLVNGTALAILAIWTISVMGEMHWVDYVTPLYIHLIAGMAAGSLLEVQNTLVPSGQLGGNSGKNTNDNNDGQK